MLGLELDLQIDREKVFIVLFAYSDFIPCVCDIHTIIIGQLSEQNLQLVEVARQRVGRWMTQGRATPACSLSASSRRGPSVICRCQTCKMRRNFVEIIRGCY